MSSCCLKISIHEGESTGTYETIAGVKTYTTGDKTSKKILIFLPDIYGFESINSRLLADSYAEVGGYYVLIPDLFAGDAVPFPVPEGFDLMGDWFPKHPPHSAAPSVLKYIEEVKATYKPDFVVGNGYCFGARPLADLAGHKDSVFDAIAAFHPTAWDTELVKNIKTPVFIGAAEVDPLFTDELRVETEKILKENKALYFITLNSTVEHGFSVKGDKKDPYYRFAMDRVFNDALAFFEFARTLKSSK